MSAHPALRRTWPFLRPFKFREVIRRFGRGPFRMLDVGAGNHSATLARRWFPRCHYTGLDRERDYHNDAADFAAMDAFIELDLTTLALDPIPSGAFDVILMAHVVEHLWNGDAVLAGLASKLKPGGMLYVEFPGPRSLRLPSMRGTLNFHDDETHVRMFTADEVTRVLQSHGLVVERAGTRRDPLGIVLLPLHALKALRAHGFVPGGVFWDLFGFAEYVVATRPQAAPVR